MKCQFFADTRDLFNWDVAERVATDLRLKLTLIPMLTKNGGGGGNNRLFDEAREDQWPGSRNTQLTRLLEPFKSDPEKSKDRCMRHIEPHFISVLGDERFWIHEQDRCNGDHDNRKPFDCEGREAYFKKVESAQVQGALIFFDPDTGVEPKKRSNKKGPEEYLRYKELKAIYEQMADNAALMLYQHGYPWDLRCNRAHKEKGKKIISRFDRRLQGFSKRLLSNGIHRITPIHLLSDWEICFFFLTKSPGLSDRLSEVLQQYHAQYAHTTFMDGIS